MATIAQIGAFLYKHGDHANEVGKDLALSALKNGMPEVYAELIDDVDELNYDALTDIIDHEITRAQYLLDSLK